MLEFLPPPDRAGQQRCRFAYCHVWVQRTPGGTLSDGMREHQATVHRGR